MIHVEKTFDENIYTLRGKRVHERVDDPGANDRAGKRILRALPLWSDALGIIGKADVVEILPDGSPYPVEHKSGARSAREADEVQLCAQALCLEEMTGRAVPRGAIFHYSSKRRREVELTEALRARTLETVLLVRTLLKSEQLPAPVADARCRKCSLLDACMPFEIVKLNKGARPR